MIVGLVGEAVVIAEDIRPLIPRLFLSPDNISENWCDGFPVIFGRAIPPVQDRQL